MCGKIMSKIGLQNYGPDPRLRGKIVDGVHDFPAMRMSIAMLHR